MQKSTPNDSESISEEDIVSILDCNECNPLEIELSWTTTEALAASSATLLLEMQGNQMGRDRQPKKNQWRERIKRDKEALRIQLEHYSAELSRLKQQETQRQALTEDERVRLFVWERIARQNEAARHMAEELNRKYRSECLRQEAVIQQLTAAMYHLSLTTAYKTIKHVLEESKLCLSSYDPVPPQVYRFSQGYECAETSVVPVSFLRIQRDLWTRFSACYAGKASTLRTDDNTLVSDATVSAGTFGFTVRFALRKYETRSGQLVFVWKAMMIGHGDLEGMDSDETGWSVIVPKALANPEATVVYICKRVVPLFTTQPSQPVMSRFAEIVMRNNDEYLMTIAELSNESVS